MNPDLTKLQPYPFQKLGELIAGITPSADRKLIRLSVGEPQHPSPRVVLDEISRVLGSLSGYPTTRGLDALCIAIADWCNRRFQLTTAPLDPTRHVLPACGTREALFSIAAAILNRQRSERPVVVLPNPFYQIYEGAALLAGAEPYFINTVAKDGYRMVWDQVPDEIWARTQLVYVCSPGNPAGAITTRDDYTRLLELAARHDFVIAADECYSEIYFDEAQPPLGLLQIAHDLGIKDYRRCVVFHSLSKRSNLPGLRSGFIAGDGELMQGYLQYRTYQGCTMSSLAQAASVTAWRDESHVLENRDLYRAKFDAVLKILEGVLDVQRPDAGFYLWPNLGMDDEKFTRELYRRENLLVLPGSYLSREAHGLNPGRQHVRMALVASLDDCIEAAQRVKRFVASQRS